MLRPIKTSIGGLRLIGLKVNIDTDTATSSIDVGASDVASYAYSATGVLDVTLKKPFRRTLLACANSVTLGHRAHVIDGSDTDHTKLQIVNHDGTSNADGDAYVLIAGHDSNFDNVLQSRQFQVLASQYKTRLMGFYVDGTGTASLLSGGYDATLTDNGTGDYTLTFKRPFARAPIVVGLAVTAARHVVCTASAVNAITVKTFNVNGGAAADADFYVLAFGFDSASETWGRFSPVMSTQRLARLSVCQVQNPAGTPTLSINDEMAAITDNGAGDYTLTWADPFIRAAYSNIPIATENIGSGSYCTAAAVSTTALQLNLKTLAGAGTSDTGCDVMVLGYDSLNQTGTM